MKHINITNWQGNITDWTKFNYIYGGLDATLADRVNLSIKGTNLRNYFRKSNNLVHLVDKAQSTFYGLNYKIEKGVITVWGTATQSVNMWLSMGTTLPENTRYYINFFHDGEHEGNIVYNVAKNLYDWTNRIIAQDTQFTFQTDYSMSAICLQFDANKQYNCTFKPMIVYGDVMPTTYETYGSMVMVENVGTVDLGTQNWEYNSQYQVFYCYIDAKAKGRTNIWCEKYTTVDKTFQELNNQEMTGTPSGTGLNVKDTSYTDVNTFKSAMNGVYLTYELAEPKVTVFNQVDLGTLEWHYHGLGEPSYYDAYLHGVVNSINISCPLYKSAWVFSTNTEDKTICIVQNAVRVRDNALQGSVEDLKAKLKGVIMLYEPASSRASTLSMSSPMQLDNTDVEEDLEYLEDTKFNEEILNDEE